MADWTAFATAFLNDTAGYINERKDKAEEYTEKQRDLSEKNLLVMQKRKQISTTVGGIAKRLIDQGVPEEVVRTAAAAGPTGLTDLDKKWSTAITDYGADFASANPELVSTMVSTNLSAEQLGMGAGAMSLDDFISSQYGLSKTATGDYKAEETGVFGRMMGYNATDRARQGLDEEMAGMGMSVYDINQAAKMADFESAAPGASVTYGKMPQKFTAADMTDELVQYGRLDASLKTNESYIAAQAQLESLVEDRTKGLAYDPIGSDGYNKLTKDINDQKAIIADLKARTYGPLIRARADSTFGDSYLSVMGPVLTERNIPLESYTGAANTTDSNAASGQSPDGTRSVPSIGGGVKHLIEQDENGNDIIVLAEDLKVDGEVVMRTGDKLTPEQTAALLKDSDGNAQAEPENVEAAVKALSDEKSPTANALAKVATEANFNRDGDLGGYARLYTTLMQLPKDQRSAYLAKVDELAGNPTLAAAAKKAWDATKSATNMGVGNVVGQYLTLSAAFDKSAAEAYAFLTGDATGAARFTMGAEKTDKVADEMIKDGIMPALESLSEYDGASATMFDPTQGGDLQYNPATEAFEPAGSFSNGDTKSPATETIPAEQQEFGPQYSLSVKQNADPDTMYRVYIPQFAGKTREFAVKGSDLEFFSDGVLAAERNPVIIMGVAEEGDNLRNVSTKKLERKFGKRPSERTKEPEKKPTPIPADEDQEKVLKDHGGAIMKAFKERGLNGKSSDREFEKALTEWSYDNQVEMPFNRNPIIYALKLFIGDGE